MIKNQVQVADALKGIVSIPQSLQSRLGSVESRMDALESDMAEVKSEVHEIYEMVQVPESNAHERLYGSQAGTTP